MLSVAYSGYVAGRIEKTLTSKHDVIFKTADYPDEFKQSYDIVYDAYLRKGYIKNKTDYRNYRQVQDSFLDKEMFIAKKGESVVMTMTLIHDSYFGLPMDRIYRDELGFLRNEGRKIAELSAFAVRKDFRGRRIYMMLNLMRHMHLYSKQRGLDDLCIAIHPKHESFYEEFLLFENLGAEKSYPLVSDNPACAKRLDLRTIEERLRTKGSLFYHTLTGNFSARDSFHAALSTPIPA